MEITDTGNNAGLNYKVGFFGASRASTVIASYLIYHKIQVTGFYSYTFTSALSSSSYTNTRVFSDIQDLLDESNIIIIGVKDSAISLVWQQLLDFSLSNKIILHLSGSLSSAIFTFSPAGVSTGSVHIPLAFSSKFYLPEQIHTVPFIIEGDAYFIKIIEQLAQITQNKVIRIKAKYKVKYHALCVLSSSLILSYLESICTDLSEIFIESKKSTDIEALVLQLAKSAVTNALNSNLFDAVTGPLIRRDTTTLKNHLSSNLNVLNKKLYTTLSNNLLHMLKLESNKKLSNLFKGK